MFPVILLSLIAAEPASTVAAAQDAPVRISINNDRRFVRGDRAKVKVRVEDDGFLVVVQADADGHVGVLYPLDPDDDNFVRGDRTYEVVGRGDRESFTVDEGSGEGAIFAAVSRDPFRFADYTVNDHWDYNALNVRELPEDPEPELTELVRRMSNGRFEYDYLTYTVFAYDDVAYGQTVIQRTSYVDPFCSNSYYFRYDCDPYYYSPSRYNVHINLGSRYRYDYYDPSYYDPFYYGYGYNSYYGYGYGRPYYPYRYSNRPIYVAPYSPFPYRDRLVSPRGFKQGDRLWDGDSYRDRTATGAGAIQATHTVYGEPPIRRAVANDPGRSPLTPTTTRTARDLSDRPSRSKAGPTKARSSDAPAVDRPSRAGDRTDRPEPRRSKSDEARPAERPAAERPTVERAPRSRERVTVPERRAEPARSEPSRSAPARAEPSRSAPSSGGGGGGGGSSSGGGGRRSTR